MVRARGAWRSAGFVVLLCCLLMWMAGAPVAAEEAGPTQAAGQQSARVYDEAGLFSESERAELEADIQQRRERLQLDLVVVTTASTGGKSSMEYADDFYDEQGFGYGSEYDGILMLINMQDREAWLSTAGRAISVYTDMRIERILDVVYEYLVDGDFAAAARAFLEQAERYALEGPPGSEARPEVPAPSASPGSGITAPGGGAYAPPGGYDAGGGSGSLSAGQEIALYAGIAVVIAGVAVGVMAMANRASAGVNPNTYLDRNSFRVTRQEDRHYNTRVTQTKIQSSSGSGGGSSTHRSSSGRSHGGGGRKF